MMRYDNNLSTACLRSLQVQADLCVPLLSSLDLVAGPWHVGAEEVEGRIAWEVGNEREEEEEEEEEEGEEEEDGWW